MRTKKTLAFSRRTIYAGGMSEEFYNGKICIDWSTWERISSTKEALVLKQLKIEVGSAHQLADLLDTIVLCAADSASDDILAFDPDNKQMALVIHPTFSETVETDSNFPQTNTIPLESVPKRLL